MTIRSVHIVDELKPDRRRAPRSNAPSIEINCEGKRYVVEDWGLGGCRFANYTGTLRPGTSTSVELCLRHARGHEGLPVKAEIVRYEPHNDNALALRFTNLSAQDLMDLCDSIDQRRSVA